jgi:hypothetical protein
MVRRGIRLQERETVMSVITAKQHIEREKGAKAERKAIIRKLALEADYNRRFEGGMAVYNAMRLVIDWIKAREK